MTARAETSPRKRVQDSKKKEKLDDAEMERFQRNAYKGAHLLNGRKHETDLAVITPRFRTQMDCYQTMTSRNLYGPRDQLRTHLQSIGNKSDLSIETQSLTSSQM